MKTVYYAHPMSLYYTDQEARDLKALYGLGFEVVNPSDAPYKDLSMDAYCKLAVSCDAVIFRAMPDGKISSGVAKEIAAARKASRPVLEFPMMPQLKFRTLSRVETRERLAGTGALNNEFDDQ